jgi:pimeloyl-ACP methyl ester carboxylesterase
VVDVAGSDGPPSWWDVRPEQGFMDALRPEEVFYNDVDPATAAEYSGRLNHQSLDVGHPLTDAAWRHVPTSYVLCELDGATPVDAQEAMSRRTRRIHRLQSGHCPFISQPAEVAEIIRADAADFSASADATTLA